MNKSPMIAQAVGILFGIGLIVGVGYLSRVGARSRNANNNQIPQKHRGRVENKE